MSTMTRPSAPKSRKKPAAPPRAATSRNTEAPDRGVETQQREAPESGRGRTAEAPDAGEGRSGLFENEFTHGRSQG